MCRYRSKHLLTPSSPLPAVHCAGHYYLNIQTSLVCNPATQSAYPIARTVGTSYVSDLCGGNAYLLTAVAPQNDIVYTAADGSIIYINPCGAVRNATCNAIDNYATKAAVCQFAGGGVVNELAGWNPPQSPITYTLLSNGIQQAHLADSNGFCGPSLLRSTVIQYICSASATTAVVQSFASNSVTCNATIVIATSAVCGTPFVPSCKYNGYDLTSIASTSIFNFLDGYYYAISPCGNVTNNVFYPSCTGEVCQDAINLATYDPASTQWTDADNGLVQSQQNGDSTYCDSNSPRQTTVRFICNTTAITPFIVSGGELTSCHYTINVQTTAVCPIASPWRANGGTINVPWVSDLCGGGAYDLTSIGFSDLYISNGNGNGAFVNPCGYVQNSSCQAGPNSESSVCEVYYGGAYSIGVYDPSRAPVTYTLIPGGLVQYYADGAFNNGYPRAMNITYTCSAAATTPFLTYYTNVQVPYQGGVVLTYQVGVTTAAVCGTPFTYRTTCGTSVYNLNSLVGTVLTYSANSATTYYVNPCGQVNVPDAYGCTGQVCQNGYILSYYTPSATTWIPADNGVVALTQDGQICYNGVPRTTYIRYICSAAATTPVIVSASEAQDGGSLCRFTIEIQTSLVCGITPSHAVGSTFYSDACGGGAYDLRQVALSQDIVTVVDGGNFVFINPCGPVRNNTCNNLGASVCYGYYPLVTPPSNDYDLARFDPVNAPISYTVLNNGVVQTHMDGDYCGSVLRQVVISYICNAAATTAQVTSFASANCQYNITVQTSAVCGTSFNVPVQTGYLCYMTYSLPGNIDYPWSVATSLAFTYNPTLSYTASGTAYQLLSGSGTRTFTNRFGDATTTTVTLSTSANLLYVGGSGGPLDANGLQYVTSSPVQLPGYSSTLVNTLVTLFNATGGTTGQAGSLVEGASSRVDTKGQAFLSNVPGFVNLTIGASDFNALGPNYAQCTAPITFTNGLRPQIEPNANNNAINTTYSYVITDGVTYSVSTRLRLTASSQFATTKDQLGNAYQTIVAISGTRTYTYLLNGATLTSTVTGLTSATQKVVDQRFFPFSLLASSPGVYTVSAAPFLDYDGLGFTISPPAPNNGFPIGSASSGSIVSVFVNGFTSSTTTAALTEYITAYGTPPKAELQQQTYTLAFV